MTRTAADIEAELLASLNELLAGLDVAAGVLEVARARFDELHRVNRALWDLEDDVRRLDDVAAIGAHKRRIDAQNLRRHEHIAAVDEAVWRGLRPPRDNAGYLSSESLGEMLDRASILALKIAVLEGARDEKLMPARAELPKLELRWQHLLSCIERIIRAQNEGDLISVRATALKLYGLVGAPR